MKAIRTRYIGATTHRGARIVASDGDGHRVVIPYEYEFNSEESHVAAAKLLCKKMKWTGRMSHGVFKHDYYFVFDGRK